MAVWLCVDAVGGGGGSVVVHSLYLYLSLYASVRFLHLFGFYLLDFRNNAVDYEFLLYTTSQQTIVSNCVHFCD